VRARRIAAIALATTVLFAVGAMSAQGEDVGLFGYSMGATGSAISFLYNQPSFGVPSDPTFELRKIYSLAEVDSGPTSHGLGSILWPGQVVGNAPPSLLFDTVIFNPTQLDALQETCLPPQVQPLLPTPVATPLQCLGLDPAKKLGSDATAGRSGYPIRAESFYPSDQSSDSQDVGAGVNMQAEAREGLADASSTTGGAGLKGVIEFGSIYSRSTSEVVKGLATGTTVTHISDLNLFGAIHISSLTATAIATSDGMKGKVDGTLTIAGMTVKDQNGNPQFAITLDKKGLRLTTYDAKGKPTDQFSEDPLGPIFDGVNKALEAQGMSIHIGQPVDLVSGPEASRSLAGLTLHLDAHGMSQFLDALDKAAPGLKLKSTLQNPTSNHTISDPIFGDGGVLNPYVAGLIGSFFQGDQTMDIVFGAVAASSAASPPLPEFPLPEVPPVAVPPISTPPFTGGGNLGGGVTTPVQPQTNVQALSLNPVGVVGIPFGLLAAVLLAGLVGASRLRLFADRVVAAPIAARCPLEEQDR